jgi:hypothetical protein
VKPRDHCAGRGYKTANAAFETCIYGHLLLIAGEYFLGPVRASPQTVSATPKQLKAHARKEFLSFRTAVEENNMGWFWIHAGCRLALNACHFPDGKAKRDTQQKFSGTCHAGLPDRPAVGYDK